MTASILRLKVTCTKLPGKRFEDAAHSGNVYEPVFLGIQSGKEVIDTVPGDRRSTTFYPEFTVSRRPNGSVAFTGPFAQGPADGRFFYLAWGVQQKKGHFQMFRRLKVPLDGLSWTRAKKALASGKPIEVRLKLTDIRGGPLCARPPRTNIAWI